MEKYYEKKAIRQGADRGCKKCGFHHTIQVEGLDSFFA